MANIRQPSVPERTAWDKVIDQLVVTPYNQPQDTDEYFRGFYFLLNAVRDTLPPWAKRELLRRQATVDPGFRDKP